MRNWTLVGLTLFCLACPAYAQKSSEYRTGHLVKVEGVIVLGGTSYKASYLISIHDGPVSAVGLYNVTIFGRDYAKSLKQDTDVPYRITGDHLFLKSHDGHEIKARLCQVKGNAAKCGSDVFADL